MNAVIVEENEDIGEVIIEISVADLPSGTASIQLPNGEIIKLNGSPNIQFTINADDISNKGAIAIIALNDEGTLLGSAEVQIRHSETIIMSDAGNTWSGTWRVLLWVLVGVLGLSAITLVVYLIVKKNKMDTGE